MAFICSSCGLTHDGPPFVWGVPSPDAWAELTATEQQARGECSSDQCIMDNERFFIIGRLDIPVIDNAETFAWLVWVEVNAEDFIDIQEKWFSEGRELTPPYHGRLASELRFYPESTLNLRVTLKTSALPNRPRIHIMDEHELLHEQEKGISQERVQEIASHFMH